MVKVDIKARTQELYRELFEYTIYTNDFVNVLNLEKIISLINTNKRYAENLGMTKEVKKGKSGSNDVYNEIINTIKEGYSEVEILKKLKPNLYIVNQIIENHEEYNRKFKKKIKYFVNEIYNQNLGIVYNIFRKLYRFYSQYFMYDEFKSIIEYGLLESIYRYIYGIGVEFSGVAYNYIKKNIVDEIRNNHGITGIDYESSHISSYVINPAIQSDKDEDIVIENINENELFELDCKECDFKPITISLDELIYDDNKKTTKLDIVSYLLYRNDYDDSDIDFNQITLDDVFNILDKYEMLSYLNYIYKTKKIDKNDYKELLSYITKKYKITEKDKLLVRLKESIYLRSANEKLSAIL